MSYYSPIYTACEDLQNRLSNVFNNSQELNRDRSAFLEFVLSPANQNGIAQTVNPGSGKARTVNLIFDQPLLESEVTTQNDRACRPGEGRGDFVATYDIDTNLVYEASEQIKVANLTRKCEANSDFIARKIMMLMLAVEKKVATVTATQAAAQMGNYSKDVIAAESLASADELIVKTLDTASQYKAGALELVQWAAEASGFPNIVGFGGRLMSEHVRLALVGCCTQWGIDVGDLLSEFGFAFAYDRRIASALSSGTPNGANLITEPGNFQLLHYVENEAMGTLGNFDFQTNNYVTGITPAGLPVDITIKEDCKILTIQIQATTKLVSKPGNLFQVGDNYEGVTGAAQVTVDNS